MLKKLIRLLSALVLGALYFFHQVSVISIILITKKSNDLLILDIDNTLSDSWPTLVNYHYSSENQRLLELKVFKEIQDYLFENFLEKINKSNMDVIFLSNRAILSLSCTKLWLKLNNFNFKNSRVLFVRNATNKMLFLKIFMKIFVRVTYFDDLSYNHENGEVKFYEEVLRFVHNSKICYFGYKQIQQINESIMPKLVVTKGGI